jgi:hypothetical protein
MSCNIRNMTYILDYVKYCTIGINILAQDTYIGYIQHIGDSPISYQERKIMNQVTVVRNLSEDEEQEVIFRSDTLPMCKHFADVWAKRNGYKLVKSPAKIAQLFPACHRVACSKNEVIFYAV